MKSFNKFFRFLPQVISFLLVSSISYNAYAELVMASPEPTQPVPSVTKSPAPKEIPKNVPPADALLLAQAPTVQSQTQNSLQTTIAAQEQLPTPQGITAPSPSVPPVEVPQAPTINAEQGISPNVEISAAKFDQSKNIENLFQQVRLLNDRVTQLENANAELQKQIVMTEQYFVSLEQGISDIQKEIQVLNAENAAAAKDKTIAMKKQAKSGLHFNGYFALNQLWTGNEFRFFVSIVLVLFLFGIWKIIAYRKLLHEAKKTHIVPTETNNNEDYDFLGGDQGIEPRLNLARAYIDMGNKHLAQNILEEILVKGNDKQKSEAELLLKKIT
jgi:FimV-like protein